MRMLISTIGPDPEKCLSLSVIQLIPDRIGAGVRLELIPCASTVLRT